MNKNILPPKTKKINYIIREFNGFMVLELNNGGEFVIDKKNYEKIKKFPWYRTKYKNRETQYVFAPAYINNKRTIILLHRLLMGFPSGLVVDHMNHDGFDNRVLNLRVCTRQENLQNKRYLATTDSSGYKGVQYDKRRSKYTMKFTMEFNSEIEAAHAYDKCAELLYSGVICGNFKKGVVK